MNKLHVILGLLHLKSYKQLEITFSKQPITIRKRLALCWVDQISGYRWFFNQQD